MILAAFVLHQAKMVSLPVEFVDLTRVAEELSTASGKLYKIDPTLSRETVYLSTKDWSVQNVSKRVAAAFRAEWQREGDAIILRRNSKVLSEMQAEEEALINKRIDEQLATDYKSILSNLQGDTLVLRKKLAEAHKKFPPITEATTSISAEENQLTIAALRLVPELRVGLEAFKRIPRKTWLSKPVLSRTHFADFKNAFALPLEVDSATKAYVVDQTNRDAAYHASLAPKEQGNLPFEVRANLRTQPLTASPRFWFDVTQSSPTTISFSLRSFTNDFQYLGEGGLSFDLTIRSDFSKIPHLDTLRGRKIDVNKASTDYIKGPSFKKLELDPAQIIYGPTLKELASENPELTVIVPDQLEIYGASWVMDALRGQPKDVGASLEKLSDHVTWHVDEQGNVIARPQLQLRHEAVRANRKAVRKLIRAALTSPAISLEEGMEYARNSPLTRYDFYLNNMTMLYGINMFDAIPMVQDLYHLRTLKLLAALAPQQREMLLRNQSLPFKYLAPDAQRLAYAMVVDGDYGSDYNLLKNGKVTLSERRMFQVPVAFERGLSGETLLTGTTKIARSLVLRPGAFSTFTVMEASSAGYVASQQLHGEFLDPMLGYPVISKSSFQPISRVELNLSVKEGPASMNCSIGFNDSPGQVVNNIDSLPSEFVKMYKTTFDYYENLRNQQKAIPPLNESAYRQSKQFGHKLFSQVIPLGRNIYSDDAISTTRSSQR